MKKLFSFFLGLCIATMMHAQDTVTINNYNAGQLYNNLLSAKKLNTVTCLIVKGSINAYDFLTMRDNAPHLSSIDLSSVNIVAYSGQSGTLGPAHTYTYNANAVPDNAFYGQNYMGLAPLSTIILPPSITAIGKNAFRGCSSISSITIPTSVTSIGDWAFEGCSSITSITIPTSVTSIFNGTFEGCSNLLSIDLPASIAYIRDSAFYKCTSLKSFTTPSSLKYLGTFVFQGCSSLKSFTFTTPSLITNIPDNTFNLCSALTSINIPPSVTSIGVWAFNLCSSLPSITIPSSVNTIGSQAFEGCSSLPSISIPSSISALNSTFLACPSLKTIYNYAKIPQSGDPFANEESNGGTMYVPFNAFNIYYSSINISSKYYSAWVSDLIKKHYWNINAMKGFTVSDSIVQIGEIANSTVSVSVSSNTTWKTSSNSTWLSVSSDTLMSNNATLTFTATANPFITKRYALVTISSDSLPSKTITVIQAARDTIYCVNGDSLSIAKTANSTTSLTINSDTTWTVTSNQSWLTISPTGIIKGNANLTLKNTANPTISPRIAIITIKTVNGFASKTITVIQSAGDATLNISANTASLANASNSTVNVNVTSNTKWQASSNQIWLTISPDTTTSYNNTLTFTATANSNTKLRTAIVTVTATGVTSQIITITQAAALPTLSVSTNITLTSEANSSSTVDVTSNTDWIAHSNQSWLTVSPDTFTSNNTLTFTATANPNTTIRTATVNIYYGAMTMFQTITVTQAAIPQIFLSATSATIEAIPTTSTTVTITSNAVWTANVNQPWITLDTLGTNGIGSISINSTANTDSVSRTATITINAQSVTQTITITQAGKPTPTSLKPTINITGNTLTSSATTGNQWYDANGLITGATGQTFTPTQNGTYYDIVTVNGVSSKPSSEITVSTITGIDITSKDDITISPNPATSKVTITGASGTVHLYNAMGVILLETTKTDIDVSTLPKGMYYVKAGTLVKPLIIQ